jgi:hypothetical protein
MEEAVRQQVADKIVVSVGSDFGRTGGYNDGNGKDHWSVTSMMFMGPGIPGNRVIGASDGRHNPLTVDPASLAVLGDTGGLRVEPGHVHRSLRKLSGLGESEFSALFPIDSPELPLFS